jgi:penicillin-binding protein 1A
MAQATTIFDRRGEPVFTIFKEQRIEFPVEKLAPILKQAVVAIEDQRFYEHRGVDVVRVAGAMLANLQSGRRSQGGSTITQQLAQASSRATRPPAQAQGSPARGADRALFPRTRSSVSPQQGLLR